MDDKKNSNFPWVKIIPDPAHTSLKYCGAYIQLYNINNNTNNIVYHFDNIILYAILQI